MVSHVDSEVVGGWKLSLQVSYLVREWEDGLLSMAMVHGRTRFGTAASNP